MVDEMDNEMGDEMDNEMGDEMDGQLTAFIILILI
jgi:hypothetical protein